MNEQHKYRATDKMSDLICDNYSLLMVMSRFGLSLGFGDKSVKDVCEAQHVDYRTFLAVANFISEEQYSYSADNDSFSIPALMDYLKRAHAYFLDFNLPAMRRKLIEAIDCSRDNDVAYLILKFFDEYAKEVRRHMEYENKAVFTYVEQLLQGRLSDVYNIATFASKHNQIDTKLKELKNIMKIVVAETSVIVRSGLAAVLKRIPNLNAHPIEVSSPEALQNFIHLHTPDIVIVNPTFGGWFDLPSFKTSHNGNSIKYIALVCSVIDNNALKEYDESIAICDDIEMITTKINRLLHTEEEDEKDSEQETLSQREKEIITCVVKGMTNKAIADKLYLSIHTVITHRRNIARKLQIHSPAGLTIYAIVNKLVELSDIKDTL